MIRDNGGSGLRLLTVNVGNPSPERASRQLEWFACRHEDVIVLTETKASSGCELLVDAFRRAGYHLAYSPPPPGQYGSLIAARCPLTEDPWVANVPCERERVATALLHLPGGVLRLVGVYVPSR